MSQTGALIEASIVPESGAAIILKRGSLQTGGRIAWKLDRKAGIAFSTKVNVADWMRRQMPAHQDRIDEIFSTLKADGRFGGAENETGQFDDTSIEAELMSLRADLAQLGNGLASDAILVATHPEIQAIDISLQRVERIMMLICDRAPR